ncbi:hypothetical protein FACS1894104_5710 [Actinomycetota bacterium]|nr:hypothetical protein FACS1894104_5710 [Actinomycetota bacterium]
MPKCLLKNLGYHLISADEVMLKAELLEIIRQLKENGGTYAQ